jgi:hypothetical protein
LRRFDDLSFVRFFGFPDSAALSEPQVFEDFVFSHAPQFRTKTCLATEVKRGGELRGVIFFIRLYLGETRVIDSWASQTTWSTPYVRFNAPTSVKKGDLIEISIQSDLSRSPSYSIGLAHKVNGSAREIGQYAWAGD